jgi:hypothetical protein
MYFTCIQRSRKQTKHFPAVFSNDLKNKANYFADILFAAIGTKNDKFVRCPEAALDWHTRRFRMLEEIVRHDPDIVCLQVTTIDVYGDDAVNVSGCP